MKNEEQVFPFRFNICAVCGARDGRHVYGCKVQTAGETGKWICVRGGHWASGDYQIVERISNNPGGYAVKIWNVWHAGEIVRAHSVLKRAKDEARFHAEQVARGIAQY